MPHRLVVLALALAMLASACAATTPIRRTAMIPQPTLPTRTGPPLSAGEVTVTGEVYGQIGQLGLDELYLFDAAGRAGDPGVLVPRASVSGSVYGAFADFVEFGGHVKAGFGGTAEPNLVGVLDFPERNPDVIGGGPGIRFNGRIPNSPVTLSLLSEFTFTRIQQVRYLCSDPCTGDEDYAFDGYDVETRVLPSIALAPTVALPHDLHVTVSGGVQSNVRNIGFDPQEWRRTRDTLSNFAVGLLGMGIDWRRKPITAGLHFVYPMSTQPRIDFNPTLTFRLGVVFGGDGRDAGISLE